MKRLELIGLEGIDEIRAGDSVGKLICSACSRQGIDLADHDVIVIAQKIISKAEGRRVRLDAVSASARARELARELDKEPELVEVILSESRNVIRTGGRALIVETHHGFVCANAGVDQSNIGLRQVALLPQDPDRSAREIRSEIASNTGKKLPGAWRAQNGYSGGSFTGPDAGCNTTWYNTGAIPAAPNNINFDSHNWVTIPGV